MSLQIDIRKLLPLVSPAVGSAVVGGGGPGASHGIICPHCTQETHSNDRPMRAFNDFLSSCCRGEKWKRFLSQ